MTGIVRYGMSALLTITLIKHFPNKQNIPISSSRHKKNLLKAYPQILPQEKSPRKMTCHHQAIVPPHPNLVATTYNPSRPSSHKVLGRKDASPSVTWIVPHPSLKEIRVWKIFCLQDLPNKWKGCIWSLQAIFPSIEILNRWRLRKPIPHHFYAYTKALTFLISLLSLDSCHAPTKINSFYGARLAK